MRFRCPVNLGGRGVSQRLVGPILIAVPEHRPAPLGFTATGQLQKDTDNVRLRI